MDEARRYSSSIAPGGFLEIHDLRGTRSPNEDDIEIVLGHDDQVQIATTFSPADLVAVRDELSRLIARFDS
jgi:hypothetical protein